MNETIGRITTIQLDNQSRMPKPPATMPTRTTIPIIGELQEDADGMVSATVRINLTKDKWESLRIWSDYLKLKDDDWTLSDNLILQIGSQLKS